MLGRTFKGPLERLSGPQKKLRNQLKPHVEMLATEIGNRNIPRLHSLNAAAGYIVEHFEMSGLAVREQVFQIGDIDVRNIEATLKGTSDAANYRVVVAHYDNVAGYPGANDNASSVAAFLEVSRLLVNGCQE